MSRKIVFSYNGNKSQNVVELLGLEVSRLQQKLPQGEVYPVLPLEITEYIFSMIKRGKTYKSIIFSSSYMYNIFIDRKDFYCNHLLTLILYTRKHGYSKKVASKKFDKKNKKAIITKQCNTDWHWSTVIENNNVTLRDLKKYHINYDIEDICGNPNLTIEDVLEIVEMDQKNKDRRKKDQKKDYTSSTEEEYEYEELDESEEYEEPEEYGSMDPYEWRIISLGKCIKLEDIENHIDLPWDWGEISKRPDITIDFFKKHIHKNWDIRELSRNSAITMADVEEEDANGIIKIEVSLLTKHNNKYESEESFSDISIDLGNLPEDECYHTSSETYTWSWEHLLSNDNLTIDFVKKYVPNPNDMCEKYWKLITVNAGISMKNIEDHLDLPWVWKKIVKNPNFNGEFLQKYIDLFYVMPEHHYDEDGPELKYKYLDIIWDWGYISKHRGITMEFINNHPEYPWEWNNIWENPNLDIKFIVRHIKDKNNNSKFYKKPPLKRWHWNLISKHKNIKMADIEKYPNIPWVWNGGVSNNPNLTADFVIKRIKLAWNYVKMSSNTFDGTSLL